MKSLNYFITLFLCILICSCGNPAGEKGTRFQDVEEEKFQRFMNKKELTGQVNLSNNLYLVNQDYPIEVSIFKDGSFYYNLPNLGDGKGTWKHENGRLKLFASRKLFDLNMDIISKDKEATGLIIYFVDRFGPKTLELEVREAKN